MQSPGATIFPESKTRKESSRGDIDDALRTLAAKKDRWPALPLRRKVELLREMSRLLASVAEEWVSCSVEAKRCATNEGAILEEWLVLGAAGRYLNRLQAVLTQIESHGRPRVPDRFATNVAGRTVARTFPAGPMDRLTLPGHTVEVHMAAGVTPDRVKEEQAAVYTGGERAGRVCLVLGAGNVSYLPIVDLLSRMFGENRVVALKMNPVNAYLGPVFERFLAPLTGDGFCRVLYGGRDVGSFLASHQLVDELHLTGSKHTYESIVFGSDEAADHRKQKGERMNTKPFTAELGNVTPIIVVPGKWSEAETRKRAVELAAWQTALAGYGCLTPRILVTHKGWPLRTRFLEHYRRALDRTPCRFAYYPGSRERFEAFQREHPEMYTGGEARGSEPREGELPWGFISGVDPSGSDEICFVQESFCGVAAEVPLDVRSVKSFLSAATEFCNTALWGSLVAHVVIDPSTQNALRFAVETMVENLDYGSVMINMYGGVGALLSAAPWGGAPGRSPWNVDSGIGWINIPFMIAQPHKSVYRGPFHKPYDPMTPSTPNRVAFAKSFARLQIHPTLRNAVRLTATVLSGIAGKRAQ